MIDWHFFFNIIIIKYVFELVWVGIEDCDVDNCEGLFKKRMKKKRNLNLNYVFYKQSEYKKFYAGGGAPNWDKADENPANWRATFFEKKN